MPSRSSRTALFIDSASLHAAATALGFDIDFRRLLSEYEDSCHVLRAFYYALTAEDQEYSDARPLLDWLQYNGYTVVAKPMKEYIDANGRRRLKGNIGVDLAVNAIQLASRIDCMVLFSGERRFKPIVQAMQRRGVHVTVVSTVSGETPLLSDGLRRQGDAFVDLATLLPRIRRPPAEVPVAREYRNSRASLRRARKATEPTITKTDPE